MMTARDMMELQATIDTLLARLAESEAANARMAGEVAVARKALEVELNSLSRFIDHTHTVGWDCGKPACVAYRRISKALAALTPAEGAKETKE